MNSTMTLPLRTKENLLRNCTLVRPGRWPLPVPFNELMTDNVFQGTVCPNILTPNVLPLLSEVSSQPDLDDSRCLTQCPKDRIYVLLRWTAEELCSWCSGSVIHPELSLPQSQGKKSSENGSPDYPKCPQKPAHGLPLAASGCPQEALEAHSFKCTTVLEGKRSATDSCESVRKSSELQCSQTQPRPRVCSHSRSSAAESLDDSSMGSMHSSRLPSSYCKTSTSKNNSARAPDLQI